MKTYCFRIYTNDDIVDLVEEINQENDTAAAAGKLRGILRGMFYTKEHIKCITVITDSGHVVFYDLLTGSVTKTSWMAGIGMSQEEIYAILSADNKTHMLPTRKAGIYAADTYYLFHMGHRIILLGDDIIISYPEIRHIQTAVCIYPLEIENQMKTAVCTNDPEKIEKSIAQFREYFYGQKMYEPKEVKKCYVRFFLAAIHFAQEIGNLNFEELNQRELLDQIMHTKTRQGLKKITEDLAERLKKQEKEIENLN